MTGSREQVQSHAIALRTTKASDNVGHFNDAGQRVMLRMISTNSIIISRLSLLHKLAALTTTYAASRVSIAYLRSSADLPSDIDITPCAQAPLLLLLATLVAKEAADVGANTNAEPLVLQAHKAPAATAIVEPIFITTTEGPLEHVCVLPYSTDSCYKCATTVLCSRYACVRVRNVFM